MVVVLVVIVVVAFVVVVFVVVFVVVVMALVVLTAGRSVVEAERAGAIASERVRKVKTDVSCMIDDFFFLRTVGEFGFLCYFSKMCVKWGDRLR